MSCTIQGYRVFDPKIQALDGSRSFSLYHPDYRPIKRFDISHSRRHKQNIVARRDGADSFLPGKLGVMRIDVAGSFAKSSDVSSTENMRDEFSGHFMRQDRAFRLFKYEDRYTKARLISASFPRGVEKRPETEWAMKFESYDPFWYDIAGDQSVCASVLLNGGEIVLPIGGEAPTPLYMEITLSDDCSCVVDIRVDDLDGALLDAASSDYNRHWWEFGDTSCEVCSGVITWDSDDANLQITTDNSDCTNALEYYKGYWFKSGPGDTTIAFSSPTSGDVSCMITVCVFWTDRWYLP